MRYSKNHNILIGSLFRVAAGNIDKQSESSEMISREVAERTALAKVDGEIVEIELDENKYEIKIKYDGKEYELEIHAITGEVISAVTRMKMTTPMTRMKRKNQGSHHQIGFLKNKQEL